MAKTVLFINKNDILKRTSLGGNTDIDKLVPHINNAQQVELTRLLGSALYNKISDLIESDDINDNAYINYKTLLDDYIKPTLVFYTMEYFIPFHQYQLANAGISRVNGDNIEAIGKEEVDFLTQKFRNMADAYAKTMDKYLCDNSSLYSELNQANQDISKQTSSYRTGLYLG